MFQKSGNLSINTKIENMLIDATQLTEMETVEEDTYLGDVISGDGRNTKNINSRISKGIGIISSITNLLDKICLGTFYFEVAVLFRESMFINGILTNAEIWHNVKKAEIE